MFQRLLMRAMQLERHQKRLVQVLMDVFLIFSCFLLAMGLRLDGWQFLAQDRVWDVLFIVTPLTILVFVRFGLYRAIIRFISARVIKVIILTVGFSGGVMFASNLALGHLIPRSVPFIYAVLLFCAVAGTRFAVRAATNAMLTEPSSKVIIYGAGDAGRQLLSALNSERQYQVVAFVDDDQRVHGREVDTITIKSPDTIATLKKEYGVEAVLLAAPGASIQDRRRIISLVESHALQLRTVPSISDILSGRAQVSDLSDVQIEDLLARETVPPIPGLASQKVENKSVLVTGAGGSIGGELCQQIAAMNPKCLILYEMSEYALYQIHSKLLETFADQEIETRILPFIGSVQNGRRLSHVMSSFNVDTVFHAAAYKHVPLVEQNIVEGVQNNIMGTRTVIKAAIEANVDTFTLISTDKAVRPTNFMGATKRIAELVCQAYAAEQSTTCISIVRFGNVLWSSGSVLPRFKEQIVNGGPVTVTHPGITRYFMTISEAAHLVLQASAMARGGEVFVLDMGEPVKIVELAKSMIRLHGMIPYLETDTTDGSGDIRISFSGLRPGEKLHEELLVGSDVSGTDHPRIMCADESKLEFEQLQNLLESLQDACDEMDVPSINGLMKNAAVDFRPTGAATDLLCPASEPFVPAGGATGEIIDIKKKRKRK
tara:strand:- start:1107 stop:3080 length:1974 start_codon:yes stop_codon:yes gene_type:complete